MTGKSGDTLQKILLSLAVILAAALMAVFFMQYRSAGHELSVLKTDLADSTAVWKQINEDKLIVQRELKAAKNDLREAELTIEESAEKIQEIENDIAELEKEIESLKSGKKP